MRDATDPHRGHESRIMHLLSRDAMLDNEALPLRIVFRAGGKDLEEVLHPADLSRCPFDAHSKAIRVNRPSCDGPEFNQILSRQTEHIALAPQLDDCSANQTVM